MFHKTSILLTALLLILGLAACGGAEKAEETMPMESAPEMEMTEEMEETPTVAIATLQSREGMDVAGTVTFTEADGTVKITAKVSGVGAGGEHGFHIHETGDCSAADFTSAGGHFNPTGSIHGGPSDMERHAGDLGNITIAADGNGSLEGTNGMISLGGGANSVLGKAVILHEKMDDLVSQPTGDAGGRIACAVIALEGMDIEVDADMSGADSDGY